jgi:ATP-binding cassette subfamily C protein
MRRSEGSGLLLTEVDRVGIGVDQMFAAIGTSITLAGLGIAALVIAPPVALGALLLGGVALIAYRRIQRRTRLLGDKYGDAVRLVRAEFDEGLSALRVIKSFGGEDRAVAAAAAASGALRGVEGTFYRTLGFGSIAIQGGGAAVLAGLVWAAVTRGGAGAETILPVVAIALRALPLLPALHHCWHNWTYAKPAMLRALELIETAEAAREPDPTGAALPPVRREIAMRGITVRYAARDRAALETVTLTLPANRITALIGTSGSGKSTVADVLGGLLVADAGTIAIDGAVLSGPELRDWRRQVTYVQQDPWLFPGTIRANLLWAAPGATEPQLHAVLQLAAADFVEALPDRLDTMLGDNGRALSGGERQRIVLARALLREPQLLILDEATSALDAATEAAIARAVIALRDRMTILVIGHRGRLCEIADLTVRIGAGRIVDDTATSPAD